MRSRKAKHHIVLSSEDVADLMQFAAVFREMRTNSDDINYTVDRVALFVGSVSPGEQFTVRITR